MSYAQMTSERKIWEAALLLYNRHGTEAATVAANEAARLRNDPYSDELTAIVWVWITRNTAEILRLVPRKDERVH